MNVLDPTPFIGTDSKSPTYYKNIRMKTDTNLHEQLSAYILSIANRPLEQIRILDWGCGEGALSQRFYDNGFIVYSVDICKQDFKANGPIFFQVDFNNIEQVETFLQNYKHHFDIVLAVEVIEHVKNPWEFIEKLKELVTFQGDIIITTPNISSWWGRFWFFFTGELWGFTKESWVEPGHINPISSAEMCGILTEFGLICKKMWPGGNLPIIWAYNWKRLLVSLMMLPFYYFLKGNKKGWVMCYHAKSKP